MIWDRIIMVDWSGGAAKSKTPQSDAIWIGEARGGASMEPIYVPDREAALGTLTNMLAERPAGERILLGFDFPFAFPAGFAARLTGQDDPRAVWSWFDARISDLKDGRDRIDAAAEANDLFEGDGPFWFNPFERTRPHPSIPARGMKTRPLPEHRSVEDSASGALSAWRLGGVGAPGSQALMGFPVLLRLKERFGADLSFWPFDGADTPIVVAEVFPSLIAPCIEAHRAPDPRQKDGKEIKDRAQVRILAHALAALSEAEMARLFDVPNTPEGWILGTGHADRLAAAFERSQGRPAPTRKRRLPGNCFALPPGVDWTLVDDALAMLRDRLEPIAETQRGLPEAGRRLAREAVAERSNPPRANAAVDGYAIKGALTQEETTFPLAEGKAAAGVPFDGPLPGGHALRILTGAFLPDGADTVILQEDADVAGGRVTLIGPQKAGANRRRAGEDFNIGDTILEAGRTLTAADLGLLAAAGVREVETYRPLRVGVLSTGDEISDAPSADQIPDANRPMLIAAIAAMGHEAVDLGICGDDRDALRAAFDGADTDVLLTSGGASAGEEDHVSALLTETGTMALWRVAVKPGRPLALGLWDGMPVFGLPGNPVAALVCTMIFARPALSLLAGGGWVAPLGVTVPAAFRKSKKAGRREYLRARLRDGAAEVFASEGSGRISGLSWAEGLVELPDGALEVTPGTPVTYLPFAGLLR
ncbi:MAG: molybdopterin-binding protein [Pseudomonadota bacterium]